MTFYVIATFVSRNLDEPHSITGNRVDKLDTYTIESGKETWDTNVEALDKLLRQYPTKDGWKQHCVRATALHVSMYGMALHQTTKEKL